MKAKRNLLVSGIILIALMVASAWLVLLSGFQTDVAYAAPEVQLSDAPGQDIEAGGTVTYVHTVTNATNINDPMVFTVTLSSSAGFTGTVSTNTFTLAKGASQTFSVSVEAPPTATVGTVDNTTVNVEPGHASFGDVSTIDTTTVVAPKGVTIDPTSDAKQGTPGGSPVQYEHTIENELGTQVIVDIGLSNTDTDFGATASELQITLDGGETAILTITVTIPGNALATDVNTTTVTVSPQTDPAQPVSATDVTTVASVPGVSVAPNDSDSALPGNPVVYEHTVTNEGNFSETFLVLAPESDQGWTVDRSTSSLTLAAFDSDTLEITVNVPNNAEGGTVDHTKITVQAQSNAAITDSVRLTTTAILEAGVLVGPDNDENTDPGETVIFQHTITNTGNRRETFDVSAVSAAGWTATPSEDEVTLNKGASTDITVSVEVPANACAEDDITTVTVQKQGGGPSASDSASDTLHVANCRTFLPFATTPRAWVAVGAGWSSSDEASSVDVCPTDDSLIFAGTDTGKVLRLNGGTWQAETLPGLPTGGTNNVRALVIDHSDCDTVYAGVFHSPTSGSANGGVWRGTRSGNSWNWSKLGTATQSGGRIRALALSGGRLFAGNQQSADNDTSLSYWNGSAWVNVLTDLIVMGMSVADPVAQTGPVYAAMWQQAKLWANTNPGGNPGSWSMLNQLADLPDDRKIVAVYGDATNVQHIGLIDPDRHYRQVNNAWQMVTGRTALAFASDGTILYAGYDGGFGVSASFDGGATFSAMNDGFGVVPQTISKLVQDDDQMFAATSSGIWSRLQGP